VVCVSVVEFGLVVGAFVVVFVVDEVVVVGLTLFHTWGISRTKS
jgi:hypothetical protein